MQVNVHQPNALASRISISSEAFVSVCVAALKGSGFVWEGRMAKCMAFPGSGVARGGREWMAAVWVFKMYVFLSNLLPINVNESDVDGRRRRRKKTERANISRLFILES